jgi:plastocyanin
MESGLTDELARDAEELLTKGSAHTQAFPAAGVYEYICGLHPNIEGSVEVQ